jgi:lipopolysaccharide transport system ATP-binding protein
MSNTAIKVENLSKIYRLGEIGTGTISRDMERWFKTKVLKQEDPFLKIGETNDRANKGKSDIVYSLQDINFEIQQGDAVGIIGRNGAGKSTLLKILSRVTTPTTGRINIKGRVASLLEVGTGFHPELTGRENIYLNGAILGMRKREIDRKLDEIIEFSGVERYIDTPVKRYSSGMYVRLAFAVAAHLESEILIVDEVLAVGDAEFQKKCLGKMGEVSKGEGRTVLFVSHNMAAVKMFCNTGVLMVNGSISINSNIDKVISQYSSSNQAGAWIRVNDKKLDSNIYISGASLKITGDQPRKKLLVNVEIHNKASVLKAAFLAIYIASSDSSPLMEAIPGYSNIFFHSENLVQKRSVIIDINGIIPGQYKVSIWLGHDHFHEIEFLREVLLFEVDDYPMLNRTVEYPSQAGFLVPNSFLE